LQTLAGKQLCHPPQFIVPDFSHSRQMVIPCVEGFIQHLGNGHRTDHITRFASSEAFGRVAIEVICLSAFGFADVDHVDLP
jgi:hypothetical protein